METPALTVNRLCGSGLQAIWSAAQQLRCHEADFVDVGGAFADEIVEVIVTDRGGTTTVTSDEHPRPGTTVKRLAALRPVFLDGGTVTAGNASGINDGAAALVLTRLGVARRLGLTPLAELVAISVAAVEPEIMGCAPTPALAKLFGRTGMRANDIDVVELNEAFASQVLAVQRDAGLDPERTNPHGGAIALGHPVGATGAILSLRAVLDLHRRDLEHAVVTLCIGGGQGIAAMFRRIDI